MEEQWEPGMNAIQQSSEFAQAGDTERAFNVLDAVLLRTTEEKRTNWLTILCEHAAILAHRIGDRGREIHYRAQALPYAKFYRFAACNLAMLLLDDGQTELAKHYATEAYEQSVAAGTDDDIDLTAAILKLWPDLAQK